MVPKRCFDPSMNSQSMDLELSFDFSFSVVLAKRAPMADCSDVDRVMLTHPMNSLIGAGGVNETGEGSTTVSL